eukprot:3874022-Alexandrium_andersonii.AAC.1
MSSPIGVFGSARPRSPVPPPATTPSKRVAKATSAGPALASLLCSLALEGLLFQAAGGLFHGIFGALAESAGKVG